MNFRLFPRGAANPPSPSPGNPGEGRGEGDFVFHSALCIPHRSLTRYIPSYTTPPVPRLLLTLALLTALPTRAAEPITVGAAISLKDALTDIAHCYESDTAQKIDLAFGSSGQLAAQIRNGAPIDLFISASPKQIDDLAKANLIDQTTRRTIATNTLVLIAPAASTDPPKSWQDLTNPKFKRIAIGDPRTVPAGEYAAQTLESLHLSDALNDRLVYGSNVRQVLSYVERNEVPAGIVYLTDAQQSGNKIKLIAKADPSTHDPITYPAADLKSSPHHEAALQFLNYITIETSRSILTKKGFTPPENPTSN